MSNRARDDVGMDQPRREEDPAPSASGENEGATDYWTLAAQTPPIPPDETPSIVGFRELSGNELTQAQRDSSLIQEIAPIRPYAKVAQAFDALGKLMEDAAARASNGRLPPRDQAALDAALRTYATAVGRLPEDLGNSLRARLPESSDSLARYDALRAAETAQRGYRLACAFPALPVDELRIISGESAEIGRITELVALPNGARQLALAAGEMVDDRPLGLRTIAIEALQGAQRLLTRWLLEQEQLIREASLRLQRLAAEVLGGLPLLVHLRLGELRDGQPDVLSMNPIPVSLAEIQQLQDALARAHRQIEIDSPSASVREPARRRPAEGMLPEEVMAAVESLGPDADGEDVPGPETASPAQPLDLDVLLEHLRGGAQRLERAWSRALTNEDTQVLLGEWSSMVAALHAEIAAADEQLDKDDPRRLITNFPPAAEEIASLDLDASAAASSRQTRMAELTAFTWLAQALAAAREPSQRAVDPSSGARLQWWASGAFAALLERATLASEFARGRSQQPGSARIPRWQASLRRARIASAHADIEAVVLHSLRAVAQHASSAEGSASHRHELDGVMSTTARAVARLAEGQEVDRGALVLLADAALRAADAICGLNAPPATGTQ